MSRTVIQSYQTGVVEQVDLPRPALRPNGVVAETRCSVISPGTEHALTDLARKSLLGKALARPDLVRQVLDKARAEGVLQTIDVSRQRLDTPIPLGYSLVGTVLEAGSGTHIPVGQRIAGTGAAACSMSLQSSVIVRPFESAKYFLYCGTAPGFN